MTVIREIEKQYFEIDNEYASKEFMARAKGHTKTERSWQRKRELNTLSYFLFLFTRLEDHIREQTSLLIIEKQSNITLWKKRAVWDILPADKEDDKLHFLKRVALLTDKSRHYYGQIKGYYEQRNAIAHGGNFTIPINMITVFEEMKTLIRVLKK